MIHQVVADPLVSGSTYNASTGMLVFQTYTHATVIPMWHYVLTGLALTVFAMLAVATVTFLCSTIFRSAMASTGVSLGLVIIGFVVAQMAIHVKWLVWLFFPVHLALFTNWAGQLSQEAQMNAPLGLGMLVLSVWGVLSLGVSLVYFSKRDILNA
jgi:ABC-2 type transport system permease protein